MSVMDIKSIKARNKGKEIAKSTDAYDLEYRKSISRENVASASKNLKKLTAANVVLIFIISAILFYQIVYKINLGDNIFPTGSYSAGNFTIPWGEWHVFLESLSMILGIITGVLIAAIIANLAIYAYYQAKIRDDDMEKLNASVMASKDIEFRKNFEKNYGALYKDMKEGKVEFKKEDTDQKTLIKASGTLPKIKLPPKVSIALPGEIKVPTPAPGAPPPIPGQIPMKKKPSGPIEGEKKIFVRCDRCEKTINVAIPKKLVLDNELEVVPISIIHGDEGNKHVLTVFLDPDFKSRRDRVSDVIYFGK
ncbi:MAG: hypothetical protein ACFFCS_10265 [Candidatus Hodarchaeota archaeon]